MTDAVSTKDSGSSSGSPPLISLIVPVYNEEASIRPFINRLTATLDTVEPLDTNTPVDYEIIMVDDGSTDTTATVIDECRDQTSQLCLIRLSRNFGKDAALTAGLDYTRGRVAILIDVDCQEPPELVPELLDAWQDGAKVVHAVRGDRRADSRFKRWTATWFYRVYNAIADCPIPNHTSDLRLLDRDVVDVLLRLPERVRFMKGLYAWAGFETTRITCPRRPRQAGTSKWSMVRLWNYALDGITNSTTLPLRIWTYIGASMATLAFLYEIFIVVYTLVAGREVPGYASLMTVILILGGLNLMALGVIGEYIGRIFKEVKGRPTYIVASQQGFD